jgi:Zn-finger nucleic acid-binding protein
MPSALCLGCGARVDDGAPCACQPVDGSPYREVGPASVRLGRCPRCAQLLASVERADTPIDECSGCGGCFVERWVLDRLVEAPDPRSGLAAALPARARTPETEVRYLRCPRCTAQMNRTVFGRCSGVIVDVCKEDGVWFDAGELAAALGFVGSGGLERARQREREEQEAERRRREQGTVRAAGPISRHRHDDASRRTELASEFVALLFDAWKG